jgi:hypothetical protein
MRRKKRFGRTLPKPAWSSMRWLKKKALPRRVLDRDYAIRPCDGLLCHPPPEEDLGGGDIVSSGTFLPTTIARCEENQSFGTVRLIPHFLIGDGTGHPAAVPDQGHAVEGSNPAREFLDTSRISNEQNTHRR